MAVYLIQEYFDSTACSYPNNVSVTDGDREFTFKGLYSLSNKLSNCLKDIGIMRQDCVAICMKRSSHFLTAIIGINKADAIYVPIDQKTPYERMSKIIEDCKPKAIICDSHNLNNMLKITNTINCEVPIIITDAKYSAENRLSSRCILWEDIERHKDTIPAYQNNDLDISYILYTSGSTGTPKGVMISHLNIVNYIDWAVNSFNINRHDRILSTAPFHFDMSTFDIHCSLFSGAKLCIAKDNMIMFPKILVDFIEHENISIWKGISSLFMYMSRVGVIKNGRMPTLKKILFAGEALQPKYLIDWMKTFPEKHFYNCYGPTEATGISIYHHVDRIPENYSTRIPIGKNIKNDTNIYLMGDNNTLSTNGEIGEICISGPCLSKGYLNDIEKTQKSFVQNPMKKNVNERIYKTGDLARLNIDGTYDFIGRKDQQVKFMGYRIELSEIEFAINSISEIRDSAVILADENISGVNQLIAFYESDTNISPDMIIEELKNKLPYYMIPKKLIRIDDMPRSNNGKIDKNKINKIWSGNNTDNNDKPR
ncbi:MAG: amino acid adenylation domain-containing protein [bacterium]|jgi:amino acid adenylation domain-containing protein